MADGKTWRIDGPASPRWVNCKACGAYRGDQCHTGRGYCAGRVVVNRKRMEALDTWAVPWKSPCHPDNPMHIWLVWRTTEDKLEWGGVPCFEDGCTATYAVERHASDMVGDRMPVDRINPHLVQMTCWATEEANPWKK